MVGCSLFRIYNDFVTAVGQEFKLISNNVATNWTAVLGLGGFMLVLIVLGVLMIIRQLRTTHSRLREKVAAAASQANNLELGTYNNANPIYEDPAQVVGRNARIPVIPPPIFVGNPPNVHP